MKVLQINAVNGILSTGRTCSEMQANMWLNGIECYTAYSFGDVTEHSYRINSKVEAKVHGLFSRIFGLQGYFSWSSTSRLINYISKLQPDVIMLRNLHANYLNLPMLINYIAKNDIATILALDDCWSYTGKCTHYTLANCDKWQSGCHNCPKLKNDHKSWFFDRTPKMWMDKKTLFSSIPRLAVVGVSDWITNEARKSFLASASIVTRIYNWIDLNRFKPIDAKDLRHRLNLENKFIVLGVASGWSNAKGLNKFIELASMVPENMVIVLVGNIRANGSLPDNIIHIKETHNINELTKYYSMADVLLNLSAEESFGKITIEALACGTPAIVINSTANPELIDDSCGMVLSSDYSLEELVDALSRIHKLGKTNYSTNAINRVLNLFALDAIIEQWIALFLELDVRYEA